MYNLDKLASIVGIENIIINPTDEYCVDWRESFSGKPLALVFPASAQQVMWVVQWCVQNKIEIVPQGGNTSLCGGSVPNSSGEQLLINLKKLDKILDVNIENSSITVEAGCTLRQVQEAAIENNLLYPLSLASEKQCTIGGNLSTNAGGVSVLKYGNTRQLCLGLEAVLPDGSLYQGLSQLYKNNMGYDLKQLLIGAEGTLGIITKATLKLFPLPRKYHVIWIGMNSLDMGLNLFKVLQTYYAQAISGFEIMNDTSINCIRVINSKVLDTLHSSYINYKWHILIEIEEHGFGINFLNDLKYMDKIHHFEEENILKIESYTPVQASKLWNIRKSIPSVQKAYGKNIKHDISLSLDKISCFITDMKNKILAIDANAECIIFGHIGDGNLHYNVISEEKEQIQKAVYETVLMMQGSIAAEHGIGKVKTQALKAALPEAHYLMAKNIKQALDKENLFNPNVIFP